MKTAPGGRGSVPGRIARADGKGRVGKDKGLAAKVLAVDRIGNVFRIGEGVVIRAPQQALEAIVASAVGEEGRLVGADTAVTAGGVAARAIIEAQEGLEDQGLGGNVRISRFTETGLNQLSKRAKHPRLLKDLAKKESFWWEP